MKNRSSVFIVIIIYIFLSSSCIENKNPVSSKIVISVDDVTITEYEFEKNQERFRDDYYNMTNRQPDSNEIKGWIQDFINRAYFLADAYKKGYDKKPEIVYGVESMAKIMVSQPKGFLEQMLIEKNIQPNDDEIVLAQSRSDKLYTIEYLKFENWDTAVYFLNGKYQLTNHDEFKNTIKRCKAYNNVIYNEEVVAWPFIGFWEYNEYIFTLKEGDITPLLQFQDGSYILYIKDIEISKATRNENEIIQSLRFYKEKKLKSAYYTEFFNSARITYYVKVINKFFDDIKAMVPLHEFDTSYFNAILHENIFYCTLEGKEVNYMVSDLIAYYNYLPFKQEIIRPEQIGYLIESLVYNEYCYIKAAELGITSYPGFVLDKENYRKNLIYDYYKENELMKSIKISDNEINHWYNLNKAQYTQPVGINVSVLSFNNKQKAGNAFMMIEQNRNDTSGISNLKGLQYSDWNINIEYSHPVFPAITMQKLKYMEENQVSLPREIDNNYLIIIKNHDYGQTIPLLNEIKEEVIQEIKVQKLEKLKQERLPVLKTLYTSVDNIDYKKYLR